MVGRGASGTPECPPVLRKEGFTNSFPVGFILLHSLWRSPGIEFVCC